MDQEQRARMDDELNRNEFAIRRAEREMAGVERALERRLAEFEADERETMRTILAEWRREHMGHEPEHPPAWGREN